MTVDVILAQRFQNFLGRKSFNGKKSKISKSQGLTILQTSVKKQQKTHSKKILSCKFFGTRVLIAYL